MLRRKETYTVTTPIPTNVPRDLALDILHSHGEIITLNPLVLSHNPIKAPRDAPADEYYSTWYEISERVQYIPGMGRFGSGKISFRGCFHDEPWGIVTHTYAPMGVDVRAVYRIVGSQSGEPPDPNAGIHPSDVSVPHQGLYLYQEVVIECNKAMISFVKGQMKSSTKVLVDRFIKKAELLDKGVLQGAVDEDGRLRTFNPADRTSTYGTEAVGPVGPGPASPGLRRFSYQVPRSPSQMSRSESVSSSQSQSQPQSQHQHQHQFQPYQPQQYQPYHRQDQAGGKTFAAELPADTYHPLRGAGDNVQKVFPAELPAMQEIPEESNEPRKYAYEKI
ncbi:hypothetical protein BJY04DRAFT_187104 [Aspergillus karnatakaensis]|uniref:uncharacterized protein n=1 Tax=Aspergillus karnatakaensis TaxID=1810916 RepID=UPI003CCE3559